MAQSILYYPTIDIQDGAWLRNALLYWDNISSIVPYVRYDDFSPELLYLQKCGIYEPVFPQILFSSPHASDFEKTFIDRMKNYKKRAKSFPKYGLGRSTVRMHRNKVYAPALHEMLHYGKVLPSLRHYLLDNKLVTDYNSDGWMEIDAQTASIYMRTLAEYVVKCHADDIVIGTDREQEQSNFYMRTAPRKSSACITISLKDCLPQPSMDVGFEELLDFKRRHTQELLEFREKLREFETALSQCSETEEIKSQTEKFRESWQRSLVQTEKMFTREQVAFTLGSLFVLVSAPSIVDPIGNFFRDTLPAQSEPIAAAALLGGAAIIGVGSRFVSYRNKVNENRSSAGFSYLLEASKAGIIRSF